jgi:S-methylmethionine-dependent homocysteine/selenocysteine methylase
MSYQSLYNKIQSGKLTILDGGVGTELQKRGVAMAPGAWCGSVSLGNQALLEKIHLDYIHAGAEIITANTFASSRIMLREAGFEKQFM